MVCTCVYFYMSVDGWFVWVSTIQEFPSGYTQRQAHTHPAEDQGAVPHCEPALSEQCGAIVQNKLHLQSRQTKHSKMLYSIWIKTEIPVADPVGLIWECPR